MTRNYIQKLWDYGYFFCPEALKITLVEEKDLPKLRRYDSVVQQAVMRYQLNYDFYDSKKLAKFIGTPYDLTKQLLKQPRCGCPDYQHPELVQATKTAWPESCRNSIKIHYSLKGLNWSDIRPIYDQLFSIAFRNWTEAIDVKFKLDNYLGPDGIFITSSSVLPDNVLGRHQLSRGTCQQSLKGWISTKHNWNKGKFVATLTHELGHALGMNHIMEPDAMMNPVIHKAGQERLGKVTEADIKGMLEIGYNRTNLPSPEPIPIPTPVITNVVVNSFPFGNKTIEIIKYPTYTPEILKWFKVDGIQCALRWRKSQ